MSMNPLVRIFVVSAVLSYERPLFAADQCLERGDEFSVAATDVAGCSTLVPPRFYHSRDRKKALVVALSPGGDPQLEVVMDGRHTPVPTAQWPSTHALWSPDSSAFFVNYSTGGLVGNFEVRVVSWSQARVRETDPTKAELVKFLQREACR